MAERDPLAARVAGTPLGGGPAEATGEGPAEHYAPVSGPAPRARRRRLGARARLLISGVAAVAATAAALMALGSVSAKPPAAPPIAKNFSLPVLGHAGEHISLASLAGKPVIINFFASWCPPCRHETPLIARFYRSTHGRVEIIGIDENDPTASALRFTHADGVRYPVGVDSAAGTANIYGVGVLPQTFFLNAQHRVVERIAGAVTLRELQQGMSLIDPTAK
jgi:cytochrome c biogenesis protein CcmG/thiol:disulfide interchange protein DsbE